MKEIKEKLRQSKIGENNPMYGKNSWDYMSEEDKIKRKEKQIKTRSKSVICLTTKRIFCSVKEAEEYVLDRYRYANYDGVTYLLFCV